MDTDALATLYNQGAICSHVGGCCCRVKVRLQKPGSCWKHHLTKTPSRLASAATMAASLMQTCPASLMASRWGCTQEHEAYHLPCIGQARSSLGVECVWIWVWQPCRCHLGLALFCNESTDRTISFLHSHVALKLTLMCTRMCCL